MESDQKFEATASLCERLSDRISGGSLHQVAYEKVVADLADTRLKKADLYGESRYEEEDEGFNLWMCFSDVHRKYIRIKQLTKQLQGGNKEALQPLKDAYADIANYGIMGVQILEKQYNENTTN